jgi:RHS repeat-associated protein
MLNDAWGNVRASSADVGRYRFTGAEQDTASGLYHMGARFYDPSIGRWLSEDPVQNPFEPVSLNFYAYVANNPLLRIDSSGLCDQKCLEDLNRRRQELAKGASNPSDYIQARELARTLETVIDRDRAYEIAGGYLDKIANGIDPGEAFKQSLDEGPRPVSAGPGKSIVQDVVVRLSGAYLLVLGAFTGYLVVYEVRHNGVEAIFMGTLVGAMNAGILTFFGGCFLFGGIACQPGRR